MKLCHHQSCMLLYNTIFLIIQCKLKKIVSFLQVFTKLFYFCKQNQLEMARLNNNYFYGYYFYFSKWGLGNCCIL